MEQEEHGQRFLKDILKDKGAEVCNCSMAVVTRVMDTNHKQKQLLGVPPNCSLQNLLNNKFFSAALKTLFSNLSQKVYPNSFLSWRTGKRSVWWLFLRTTLSPQAAPLHMQWDSSCLVNILPVFTALVQWDRTNRQMLIYM